MPEEIAIPPEFGDPSAGAEIAAGLRDMVADLLDKYRQAILLTEFDGLKQTELAERLGLSPSGAKSRVQLDREMLRQSPLECCHFEFDRLGGMIAYTPKPGNAERLAVGCIDIV